MNCRGFTLFELLLVLSVLAGLSAIALPVLERQFVSRQTLDSRTASAVGLLERARQAALDKATPIGIVLDADAGQLKTVELRRERDLESLALQAGLRFEVTSKNTQPQNTETQNTQTSGTPRAAKLFLLFREDGSSTGGQLLVRSSEKSKLISVARASGCITCTDGAP